jgi:hypothetical protein
METLTIRQAYEAMALFLEGVYQRTNSDDLGALLGDLQILEDGGTADPAAWQDWSNSVRTVLSASGQ